MLKVGDLLKTARLKKKLTFTQASDQLKIPIDTLKFLERNCFSRLPASTYTIGFIRNYAKLIDLDPNKTIAIFKRDYQKTRKKIIPSGLTKPLNSPWSPNPPLQTLLFIIAVALLFFSYLGYIYFQLNRPPKLNITQPENGQELTAPVLIKGKTDHDAVLTLNGKSINLETDGSFTTVYTASPGTHELKLISTSRRHQSTLKSLHLIIK